MAKHLDLAGLTAYDKLIKGYFRSGLVDITDDAINALFATVTEGPAYNEIWYTSSDGNAVNPTNPDAFGISIVSNEYNDSKGIITFDRPVTSIGDYAFFECYSLTSVTIPNSVTSIGRGAFQNCFESLYSVTIPDSVTSIGDYTFQGCCSLTSITIPNSVKSIGESAFNGCNSLTSIYVEDNNTIYDSRDNCNAIIETATNTLIVSCQNTVIPNSVKSIGFEAFYGSSLNSIIIPNSVTNIGDRVFMYSNLTSVTIGNSVTSIGDSAFSGSNLTTVTIPNSATNIGDYAFGECDHLTSINFEGTVEQWNSIAKDEDWNYAVPAKYVQCSDGQVKI